MTKNRKVECKHKSQFLKHAIDGCDSCSKRTYESFAPSTPEPSEEWVDRFRKECGELWEYHSVVGAYTQAQEEVESFIRTLLAQREKSLIEKIEKIFVDFPASPEIQNAFKIFKKSTLSEMGEKGGVKHGK